MRTIQEAELRQVGQSPPRARRAVDRPDVPAVGRVDWGDQGSRVGEEGRVEEALGELAKTPRRNTRGIATDTNFDSLIHYVPIKIICFCLQHLTMLGENIIKPSYTLTSDVAVFVVDNTQNYRPGVVM